MRQGGECSRRAVRDERPLLPVALAKASSCGAEVQFEVDAELVILLPAVLRAGIKSTISFFSFRSRADTQPNSQASIPATDHAHRHRCGRIVRQVLRRRSTRCRLEVVVLTRSHKDFLDGKSGLIEQRITDYTSAPQLTELLKDCDALVGTIFDMTKTYADIHQSLIEACKQTPKCKRFVPCNVVVKNALRAQHELEWITISLVWLVDYIVPSANRYHADVGPLHALDLKTKSMVIPGTGNEKFSITSPRDTAKAVAKLLKSSNTWRPYTYVQGVVRSVDELRRVFERNEPPESAITAEFKLYVPSGHLKFDQDMVKRDRAEYFPNVHFRTAQELLDAVKMDPNVIV
ncbi:hypothetical protein PHYPSEUDO_010728 [Phytophthora pseudosyringae]|uniref:NmrA-like domain-containing protein n=1 Tax=Phytophthora pseudosyringae TaxID=221518 RepID=A0A8T1VAJ5_9STRA|nr:hypothetical protein PHYPSEUDO_010728 [Phytophthora pseudosyringae]